MYLHLPVRVNLALLLVNCLALDHFFVESLSLVIKVKHEYKMNTMVRLETQPFVHINVMSFHKVKTKSLSEEYKYLMFFHDVV